LKFKISMWPLSQKVCAPLVETLIPAIGKNEGITLFSNICIVEIKIVLITTFI
jgi:hypothetical protein